MLSKSQYVYGCGVPVQFCVAPHLSLPVPCGHAEAQGMTNAYALCDSCAAGIGHTPNTSKLYRVQPSSVPRPPVYELAGLVDDMPRRRANLAELALMLRSTLGYKEAPREHLNPHFSMHYCNSESRNWASSRATATATRCPVGYAYSLQIGRPGNTRMTWDAYERDYLIPRYTVAWGFLFGPEHSDDVSDAIRRIALYLQSPGDEFYWKLANLMGVKAEKGRVGDYVSLASYVEASTLDIFNKPDWDLIERIKEQTA